MKILIYEKQLELLQVEPDYLNLLCSKSKNSESPACQLLDNRHIFGDELNESLSRSIEIIYKFFKGRSRVVVPKIIKLANESSDRTVSFLKTIADFIIDKDFNDDTTKKQLRKLRNLKSIPDNFEELLKNAREKEYSKYEKEFVGDYFDEKKTKLTLNYSCEEFIQSNFLNVVEQSKELSDEEFEKFLMLIKNCIRKSFTIRNTVKADVVSSRPLYVIENGEKVEVFPANSNFEIKKMDTNIDSYLSEFFSIFKQSKIAPLKPSHLESYNKVIDDIFNWIKDDEDGKRYLNSVVRNLSGIIYDKFTIIPIKYIELYWSNLGQRNETERRLSIRFRINPIYKGRSIDTYVFNKNSDILDKKEMIVPTRDVEYIVR